MNPNDVSGLIDQAQDGHRRSTTIDPNCLNGVGEVISAAPNLAVSAAEGAGAAAEVGGLLVEAVLTVIGGIFSG